MEQELRLKREAAEKAFEAQAEKDHTLMRLEELRMVNHHMPVVAQVSLAETAPNAPPTLKDPKFWTVKEKKTRKIDRLAISLLIQMRDFEYGEQDKKAAILYEYKTFKATEGEQLLDTYLRYLQVINDFKKRGYKKDNYELNYKFLNNLQPEWKQYGDMNDAMGYKKKAVVVTSDPLALVAEKTKVSKRKEKVVVQSESEGNCKKAKVKDYNYYKTKMLLAKKYSNKQVLLAEDQAWMESSSDSDQEINANMVFMAKMEKVLSDPEKSSSFAEQTIAEVSYYTSDSETESEYETL
nr:hypothetical protein [Tanacetum cinerariifolium]